MNFHSTIFFEINFSERVPLVEAPCFLSVNVSFYVYQVNLIVVYAVVFHGISNSK